MERLVWGRFLVPAERKIFFEEYKETEALWEILSPSPELRDHIDTFTKLAKLYAAVRNAYGDRGGFVADLAYKTGALVKENALQYGLGDVVKTVTFDLKTLDKLRGDTGSDAGKVFNLVRGLQQEVDDSADAAPVLLSLKDRAERILKDIENRNMTGLAAMDLLGGLAREKDEAMRAERESGLSPRAFGVYWRLKDDPSLRGARISIMDLAREVESLLARFPNAGVNADEQRKLRAALYRPLLALDKEERGRVVDNALDILLGTDAEA